MIWCSLLLYLGWHFLSANFHLWVLLTGYLLMITGYVYGYYYRTILSFGVDFSIAWGGIFLDQIFTFTGVTIQ